MSNNFRRIQINATFKIIQIIAPNGLPSKAIYPLIEPIIVGNNTHNNESPIPDKGPINEVFNERTASSDSVPCCSCIADRKSTRLNSSHVSISYAVFCLKKKKI